MFILSDSSEARKDLVPLENRMCHPGKSEQAGLRRAGERLGGSQKGTKSGTLESEVFRHTVCVSGTQKHILLTEPQFPHL